MGLAFTLTMSGSGILLLTFLQSHSHDCYDILWKCFFLSLSRMLLVSSPKINSEHMFSFNCLIRFQTVFAPPVFTDNLLCGAWRTCSCEIVVLGEELDFLRKLHAILAWVLCLLLFFCSSLLCVFVCVCVFCFTIQQLLLIWRPRSRNTQFINLNLCAWIGFIACDGWSIDKLSKSSK